MIFYKKIKKGKIRCLGEEEKREGGDVNQSRNGRRAQPKAVGKGEANLFYISSSPTFIHTCTLTLPLSIFISWSINQSIFLVFVKIRYIEIQPHLVVPRGSIITTPSVDTSMSMCPLLQGFTSIFLIFIIYFFMGIPRRYDGEQRHWVGLGWVGLIACFFKLALFLFVCFLSLASFITVLELDSLPSTRVLSFSTPRAFYLSLTLQTAYYLLGNNCD